MKKSSLRTVKEKNRRLILRALLTEGGLSRIELAKQTGLSPSTITALVGWQRAPCRRAACVPQRQGAAVPD